MAGKGASPNLTLTILPGKLAIVSFSPEEFHPGPPPSTTFWSATYTTDEVSIVMPEQDLQPGWKADAGWRGLKVAGPLSLGLTGILDSLTDPLAAAGVSIFAISTYQTDYLLIRETDLSSAIEVLRSAGHTIA
jgi:hypothetical protein